VIGARLTFAAIGAYQAALLNFEEPMRSIRSQIVTALSAAARPFNRPCDWRSLCVAMSGSQQHQTTKQPEQGPRLRKPE
jgi:hypothetical protein